MADAFPRLEWDQEFEFPDPSSADDSGLVGAGGNLSPGMLVSAYRQGLFPWFTEEQVPFWFCPDPRFVLEPPHLHVSESLAKLLKKNPYRVTFDTAFADVMHGCSETRRPGQRGTWITSDYFPAYTELHKVGFAHSVEVWRVPGPGATPELVGGLYGIHLGGVFCGESMFSRAPNASKVGFATLVPWLAREQGVQLVDCQQKTPYLASFGAVEIPRTEFLARLKELVVVPGPQGKWAAPQ
ncbi:MAG: leucyl/phenylalanyl-tRNA--protein transferase [Spirochaetales bacterium]